MKIAIYTDGACSGNPGKGGYGAVIISPDEEMELSGGFENTTNNRMELLACIKAFELVDKKFPKADVDIYTDSQYVKNGINLWIENWRKNNFYKNKSQTKPVLNKDLWKKLDILNQKINPSWHWVKGHSGDEMNERADRLAVCAMDGDLICDEEYIGKSEQLGMF